MIEQITVGLYADYGCRGKGLVRWAELLEDSPDVRLKVLSGQDIRNDALGGLDLLVMPGGRGDWQYAALHEEGAEKIRRYVADGGKYFGTCCGIAIALNEDNPPPFKRLRMLPYKRIPGPVRGGVVATVNINSRGAEYFGIEAGDRKITYHNGPALMEAEPVPLASNVEVLATMNCELSHGGPVVGPMYGTPACIRANYGKGEMLAFNCHPEYRADSRDLIVAGINALTGHEIHLATPKSPKGQERVGFVVQAENGHNILDSYFKLRVQSGIFVIPLTLDELASGRGDELDRVVYDVDAQF